MIIEVYDEEQKSLAPEQKVQQLETIIGSLNQRHSEAKCNNVKSVLSHPLTLLSGSLFIGISGVFSAAYALALKEFNKMAESCPDFLKQCNQKVSLNDELTSCSTKLVKKLCNSQKEVEVDLQNALTSTEYLIGFALLIAFISFYRYCSANARLHPSEATQIMQLTGEDLSTNHNPVKKINELINRISREGYREGYRDNALFQQPDGMTPLLEPEQPKGWLRSVFGC